LTQFIPHVIDNDSGIGTQFVVADFNGDGLVDVVAAKRRVCLYTSRCATKGNILFNSRLLRVVARNACDEKFAQKARRVG